LGAGTQPIPFKRLSVERLENAITDAIHAKEIRRRAAVLGERIRSEDGIARAVELIHCYLSSV
jgi:UDP:flavonoid glycosyltransferase YjiC (YdhE family)